MATDGPDPRARLAASRGLARRVRRERRATWFPLLVFAVVTFLAIPVTRNGHAVGLNCRALPVAGPPLARVCVAHNSAAFVYWPVALIVAYLVIAAFHLHRSRARGVAGRIGPYLVVGVLLAVAVTAGSVWASRTVLTGRYDIVGWHLLGRDVYQLVAPACAIGLALLVLAAIERSVALLLVTLAYLVVAVGGVDLGWRIAAPSPWTFVPHLVVAGGILLLASAGFAVAQRPRPRPGPPGG
ncbi:MAG TPA: hypothetical protein VMB79_03815 [Jatrophihabitans sp.]|nr:hypothetical protein [Jatrophihabitans sp.]